MSNNKAQLYLPWLIMLMMSLASCREYRHKRPQSHRQQQATPAKSEEVGPLCHELFELLAREKYDNFYGVISPVNIAKARQCFENEALAGASFNYGALVNAGLITSENKKLLKPNIKLIKSFKDVLNDDKCYMNAPLYAMANSDFFDDFLEIDQIYEKQWLSRKPMNLVAAYDVLKSLREVIYEIRRGQHTNARRIAKLRDDHADALARFSNEDLLFSTYFELLHSYHFENIISGSPHYSDNINTNIGKNAFDQAALRPVLKNFHALRGVNFGPIHALVSLPGNQDLIYLDSLFSILDPWGHIARYLSLAMHEDSAVNYHPSYAAFINLDLNYLGTLKKIRIFYDDLEQNINNVHLRTLRDPHNKQKRGKIIYKYEDALARGLPRNDQGFKLIAKTKHSAYHQIAELFNESRKGFETHYFFGEPSFSKKISAPWGRYEDQLSFYELLQP